MITREKMCKQLYDLLGNTDTCVYLTGFRSIWDYSHHYSVKLNFPDYKIRSRTRLPRGCSVVTVHISYTRELHKFLVGLDIICGMTAKSQKRAKKDYLEKRKRVLEWFNNATLEEMREYSLAEEDQWEIIMRDIKNL